VALAGHGFTEQDVRAMPLVRIEKIVHVLSGAKSQGLTRPAPTAQPAAPGATTRTVKSMRRRKPQAGRA
jgi:hypothetical protein